MQTFPANPLIGNGRNTSNPRRRASCELAPAIRTFGSCRWTSSASGPNVTKRGHLKCARCVRHQAMMSPSVTSVAPGFSVTKACGVSPHFSSGRATTAASITSGMLVEHFLDLQRRDVLAAGDDDVLRAVLDLHIAVGMHHREIAGVEPAAGECLRAGRGVLQIALHHRVAAQHQLAHRRAVRRRPAPSSPDRAPPHPPASACSRPAAP